MASRGSVYLVLGGSGQLGAALRDRLSRDGNEVLAPTRAELDLASPSIVERLIEVEAPVAVLNAAAFTDVALAERPDYRPLAFALNRDVPRLLAQACRRCGSRLVHVSTDFVFDGEAHEPYREDHPTRPLQEYGRSKLEGEREVLAADASALVVRTSTLFGPGARRRPNYVDAILLQAHRGSTVEVVELPVASPTFAPDLADAVLRLLQHGASGIVHVTNSGSCTRLELARAAVEAAGLDGIEVRRRTATADGVSRPPYSALDTTRFATVVGAPLRPWREAVADHVRRSRS